MPNTHRRVQRRVQRQMRKVQRRVQRRMFKVLIQSVRRLVFPVRTFVLPVVLAPTDETRIPRSIERALFAPVSILPTPVTRARLQEMGGTLVDLVVARTAVKTPLLMCRTVFGHMSVFPALVALHCLHLSLLLGTIPAPVADLLAVKAGEFLEQVHVTLG